MVAGANANGIVEHVDRKGLQYTDIGSALSNREKQVRQLTQAHFRRQKFDILEVKRDTIEQVHLESSDDEL